MVRHTGEDFIDAERVSAAEVMSLKSPDVSSADLDAPETD
jgi:hypothetical protein